MSTSKKYRKILKNAIYQLEKIKTYDLSSKHKIKSMLKATEKVREIDLSKIDDSTWDNKFSPLYMKLDDLIFYILFNQDYWEIYDKFCTPGNREANKLVLWDNGYPPEQLLDMFHRKEPNKKEVLRKYKLIRKRKRLAEHLERKHVL